MHQHGTLATQKTEQKPFNLRRAITLTLIYAAAGALIGSAVFDSTVYVALTAVGLAATGFFFGAWDEI